MILVHKVLFPPKNRLDSEIKRLYGPRQMRVAWRIGQISAESFVFLGYHVPGPLTKSLV